MLIKPAFVWKCPACAQMWPSFSEEQPLSFTVCQPCTYAWASKIARACRDAGALVEEIRVCVNNAEMAYGGMVDPEVFDALSDFLKIGNLDQEIVSESTQNVTD